MTSLYHQHPLRLLFLALPATAFSNHQGRVRAVSDRGAAEAKERDIISARPSAEREAQATKMKGSYEREERKGDRKGQMRTRELAPISLSFSFPTRNSPLRLSPSLRTSLEPTLETHTTTTTTTSHGGRKDQGVRPLKQSKHEREDGGDEEREKQG